MRNTTIVLYRLNQKRVLNQKQLLLRDIDIKRQIFQKQLLLMQENLSKKNDNLTNNVNNLEETQNLVTNNVTDLGETQIHLEEKNLQDTTHSKKNKIQNIGKVVYTGKVIFA